MPDLERLLRGARPAWPEPSSAAEARARAALGFGPAPRAPRGWLARASRTRGARLLVPAALLLTAGAAVAATLIGTGSSGASAGRAASLEFGPPETVGGPVSAFDGRPAVAVDGRGVVTVAWGRAGRIVLSSRPPGGDWSPPERVSDPSRRATYPRVGADRAGDITVTWRERTAGERFTQRFTLPSGAPAGYLTMLTGERWAVVARTRPAGGTWGDAQRLSDETAAVRDMEVPGLAVAPGGRAVVTWDAGGALWSRVRPPGGDWSPATRIGRDAGEAVDPQLTGSPSGGAILAWSNRIGDGGDRHYAIHAAVLDPGGTWGEAAVIDARADNPPHATGALGSRGEAVVAWISESADRTATSAAVRRGGGDWGPPAVVATADRLFGLSGAPAVAGDGSAIVVSGPRGRVAIQPPGGSWRPLSLSPLRGRSFGFGAFGDAAGNVVVVRGATTPPGIVLERADGAGGPVRVGGGAVPPAVAAGADGTTVVAWPRFGQTSRVLAAVAEAPR